MNDVLYLVPGYVAIVILGLFIIVRASTIERRLKREIARRAL